jgi:hypothetical protein
VTFITYVKIRNEKWRILISQFGQKVNETDPKLKPFFDFKNKLETLAKGDKGAKKTPASTPTPSTRKKTVKKRLDFTSVIPYFEQGDTLQLVFQNMSMQ